MEAKSNIPIGIMENAKYQDMETDIAPGDMIMLYTDGLTEAMNEEEKMFGYPRIVSTIGDAPGEGYSTPKQLLDSMKQAVSEFVCGAEQSDDLTMLAILYKGA